MSAPPDPTPSREPQLGELARQLGPVGRPDLALMQIPAEQGALMTFLAGLVGAEVAVEVGTFTGYSALSIARGLVPGGRLIWKRDPNLVKGFVETELWDSVSKITAPALYVIGGASRIVPPART